MRDMLIERGRRFHVIKDDILIKKLAEKEEEIIVPSPSVKMLLNLESVVKNKRKGRPT